MQLAAWLVGLAITLPVEWQRLRELGPAALISAWNVDTTPYFLLLLSAPLFWLPRRGPIGRAARGSGETASKTGRCTSRAVPWLLALLVGFTSVGASAWVASRPVAVGPEMTLPFGDLPPAYHDEYSYLVQAKTFLAGRWSSPSHSTAPELFDQVHVLNEGRFASRYFPGAGLWMAPWVALGHPYWGHWLAGALTAFFVFWTGRELGGDGVGLLAGMLTALAPGMALFSNLLLAHHPTLAGLSLFLFAFLRMMRTQSLTAALAAGVGLAFAMLCRPMTAAGVALPFGLWLAWRLLPDRAGSATAAKQDPTRLAAGQRPARSSLLIVAALGGPLVAGFGMIAWQNHAITGAWTTTPYQLYTDIYTPRHVYGFDNVKRGEERLGPKVLESYDAWAENLTPALAARNVGNRAVASAQWMLGIVPLAMAAVVFLAWVPVEDRRWWLVAASLLSLHALHVPYWYDGIMHYHYVFESGPLLLLMFAGATAALFRRWRSWRRPWMPLWWSGLIATPLVVAYTVPDPLVWPISRIDAAVSEIAFSRRQYREFNQWVEQRVTDRPALVLIDPGPESRHIDFVLNDPSLAAPVLRGRYRPGRTNVDAVRQQFPERALYLIRIRPDGWDEVPTGRE